MIFADLVDVLFSVSLYRMQKILEGYRIMEYSELTETGYGRWMGNRIYSKWPLLYNIKERCYKFKQENLEQCQQE